MIIALAFFITLSLWFYMERRLAKRIIKNQREYIEIVEQDLQDLEEELMNKERIK